MTPTLGVAQEEALIAGEAVDHRCRLVAERMMIGVERDQRAAEIGDVLAHGEIALKMDARKRLVAVEWAAERGGARRELLGVGIRPPVGQHAGAVIFAALVVKAV